MAVSAASTKLNEKKIEQNMGRTITNIIHANKQNKTRDVSMTYAPPKALVYEQKPYSL